MIGSMRRLRPLVLLLVLSTVSLAAACSSDDEPGETLASFMGWDGEDTDAMEARWREQETRVQELIRECMAREGFEYVPVDNNTGVVIEDELDAEEHARTRGFGITTWYGMDPDDDPSMVDDAFEDPNWDIVEAMSDVERQAYYDALHGSDEEMREHADIEYDPETGEEVGYSFSGFGFGCEGEAREEVHGGGDVDTQALWAELEPAFEELYERVQSDPRYLEAEEEWAACMTDAGYHYRTQQDMHEQIYDDFDRRLQDIMSSEEWVDPFEGWSDADIEAFHEESSREEIDAFYREADRQRMASIDQEALEALQQEEIDLAVADFECRGGEAQWELYERIAAEYEGEFIAEHRELLEQIRDAEGR